MSFSQKCFNEMRILAIEDGKLINSHNRESRTILVGVKFRRLIIEDICFKEIMIDGLDATDKTLKIIEDVKPIDLIILGGISYGGFNLINAADIWRKTKIPTIIFSKKKPDNMAVIRALMKHFPDWRERWNIIRETLKISRGIYEVKVKEKEEPVYIEPIGIKLKNAEQLLRKITVWGRTPEPIRVVNIIAKEISEEYLKIKKEI